MGQLTPEILKQIQDINGDPSLASQERKAALNELMSKAKPDKLEDLKNKLGLASSETKEEVIEELKRLSKKSDATWKALKLNKKEVLKEYGI